jgi:hypothetical protein
MYFLKWKYLQLTKYKNYYKKIMNNLPHKKRKLQTCHQKNYNKKIVKLIN